MIDSHSHLQFPELAKDLDAVLERARVAGVSKIIIPGTSAESSASGVAIAEPHPELYAAVGIHPCSVLEYTAEGRELMKTLLVSVNCVVALGEVGLDYYHFEDVAGIPSYKKLQQEVFIEMINNAKSYNLPLIIHSREAFADSLALLREHAQNHPTVIHCFTGTYEEAKAWLDLGCLLSFTGIITYTKNEALREMVGKLPLDRIMIETDAPYLAPQGFRREQCEPQHVRQVALCLADIFKTTFDSIDQATTQTTEQFFNLA
jgi:TatD DNase family protein